MAPRLPLPGGERALDRVRAVAFLADLPRSLAEASLAQSSWIKPEPVVAINAES